MNNEVVLTCFTALIALLIIATAILAGNMIGATGIMLPAIFYMGTIGGPLFGLFCWVRMVTRK
jgi:hypothetical protein